MHHLAQLYFLTPKFFIYEKTEHFFNVDHSRINGNKYACI
jgi:hypothetical protein